MATVYIPSLPTRYEPASGSRIPAVDLNPATRFGTLKVLLSLDGSRTITEELQIVREGIRGITSEDFIIAVGDPVLIAAALAYASISCDSVRMLRWDRINKRYDVITVPLRDEEVCSV